MSESGDVCPKCGKPRFEDAIDCAFCGIVFARFEGEGQSARRLDPESDLPASDSGGHSVQPVPGPHESPEPPGSEGLDDLYQGAPVEGFDDVYQGPPVSEQPSRLGSLPEPRKSGFTALKPRTAAPQSRIGELLNRDLSASLMFAVGLFLLAQLVLNTQILGGATDVDSVGERLNELAGLQAPEGLRDAGYVRFVGRDFVWFTRAGGQVPTLLFLLRHRSLGGWKDGEQLKSRVKGWMDGLGVEWESTDTRAAEVGTSQAQVELLRLGGDTSRNAPYAALITYVREGKPALLVLAGRRESFDDLYKTYVRRAR